MYQVEELAKAKLEKPKRLRELAARDWREIDDGTLIFDRPAAEVAALRTLSKADVLQFFQVGAPLLEEEIRIERKKEERRNAPEGTP